MFRTLCVLALLTLQAGLAHCLSWDIVAAAENRLAFYNEGKVTHSVTFTDVNIRLMTYDPFHNRVLFTNNYRSLLSFDIATGKNETLIDLKLFDLFQFTYDPVTGLFFVVKSSCKVYSYLVKHESNHGVDANFVIHLGDSCGAANGDITVDSCGGYIYWINSDNKRIERVRLNGSGREELLRISDHKIIFSSLTIDPQTQKMYWMEQDVVDSSQHFLVRADLNGKHRRKLYEYHGRFIDSFVLTVSNDFIYWTTYYTYKDNNFFSKFPKNLPLGTNVEPEQITYKEVPKSGFRFIAANYAIEEQTQGTPLCNALKRLLPNYSETNDSDSFNVSTGGSLLPVNETKVSGESRVSGDTLNVPVCQYYCLQGNCSVSADGQPKCRCNVGYAGLRCEVNACQTYCLHDGVCSLSEQNNPECQCTGDYQGERCDVPAFLIKCSQAVSLFKDILNADLASVTEGKGLKSTCASTVV